jgi:preprotein translocase subunit YajC
VNFFISSAYAQAAPAAPGFDMNIIFVIGMFGLLYFFMIRPQMKRAKEQKAMIAALQKGDEVVAAGGLIGRIIKINDQYVTLELAPNVEVTVQRAAVQVPLPKGTIKSIQ